jgi:hypothetical protein
MLCLLFALFFLQSFPPAGMPAAQQQVSAHEWMWQLQQQ